MSSPEQDVQNISTAAPRAPVECSSSFCAGNTEVFATSSGRLLPMQCILHEQEDANDEGTTPPPVQCSTDDGSCSGMMASAGCIVPVPSVQLFQGPAHEDDDEETEPHLREAVQLFQDPAHEDDDEETESYLREAVQECSSNSTEEQFAVSSSIPEMNFDITKSELVCGNTK